MDWGGADFATATAAGTVGAAWALTPADVRTFYVDPTVIRHQLLVAAIMSGAAPAAPVTSAVAVGVIAFDYDPDLATVPTEFPEPYGDPEADWLIRVVIPIAPSSPITVFSTSLDWLSQSRAMRRLGNQRGLLLVHEAAGIASSINTNYRFLLKE